MSCHNPITAYRSRVKNSSGKRPLVFNRNEGFADMSLDVPCGQCIGCKLAKSKEWAVRITQEASLHERSSFLTLTYSDRHLPPHNSLRKKDLQDFLKRLRFHSETPLRFFACGEYGETSKRAHYHICLFGLDFSSDRKLHAITKAGHRLYTSQSLSDRWTFGHSIIGDLNFETAAYTARYVTKKITGANAPEHYGLREPEFATMSRRPGIGLDWLLSNLTDVENNNCWSRGHLQPTPKYYQKKINQTKNLINKYKNAKEAKKGLKQKNPYVLDAVQKAKFNLKPKKEI